MLLKANVSVLHIIVHRKNNISVPPVANTVRWLDKSRHMTPR